MTSIKCLNEYDTLRTVIMCEPRFLMEEKASIDMARKQYRHLVSTLKELGVKVIELSPLKQFPEQVYTRDIGFVLGDKFHTAKMSNYLRQGEEEYLGKWLEEKGIPFHSISKGVIEGGDVLIDGETIYVGLSNRTNEEAVQQLRSFLPDYDVISIPFTDAYLHLDCVFNILSPNEAIIYPDEIHGEKVKILKSRYDLIEITKNEQVNLATNVLSIGGKRVFSLPVNTELNRELTRRGYEVIEVDITEIIKFGGSFRCCTLPLLREG